MESKRKLCLLIVLQASTLPATGKLLPLALFQIPLASLKSPLLNISNQRKETPKPTVSTL